MVSSEILAAFLIGVLVGAVFALGLNQLIGYFKERRQREEIEIPAWLCEGVPQRVDIEKILTPSRKGVYKTLELFHSHVRYVITIMFSLLTALFAILTFSENLGVEKEVIETFIGYFLVAISVVAIISIVIIHRYYLVYVSSLVFAVRVHLASPFKYTHPWFIRTIEQAKKWGNIKNDLEFIKKRARSPTDTFVLYACIIFLLACLSGYSGLRILASLLELASTFWLCILIA